MTQANLNIKIPTTIEMYKVGLVDNKVLYKFIVTTDKKPTKASGHKFTAILGKNPWCDNPLQLHADFLKLTKTEDSDIMATGRIAEPAINKAYFGDRPIKTYTYEETKGDLFPYDDIFGGILDAYALDTKDVYEIKTVFDLFTKPFKKKELEKKKEQWFLQVMLYWYLYGMNEQTPTNKAYVLVYPVNGHSQIVEDNKNGVVFNVDTNKLIKFELPSYYYENATRLLNEAATKYKELFLNKNGIYEFEAIDSDSLKKTIKNIELNAEELNVKIIKK